jgi:hypothetical protein
MALDYSGQQNKCFKNNFIFWYQNLVYFYLFLNSEFFPVNPRGTHALLPAPMHPLTYIYASSKPEVHFGLSYIIRQAFVFVVRRIGFCYTE